MIRWLAILSVLLLVACSRQYTYYYYMTHPDALREAVIHCLDLTQATTDPTCHIVSAAQKDFEDYANQAHIDPQDFGRKIMLAENQLMSLQETLLQQKSTKPIDEVKVSLTQQAYHAQKQKVNILLSIVAVTSWEGL